MSSAAGPIEPPLVEWSTAGDAEIVVHVADEPVVVDGLDPDTDYAVAGLHVRTLPRPEGELLCRFATVNDVHFGETVAGIIDGNDSGAIRPEPGEAPYPETMSAGAIEEIARIDPAVVLAKGDLTSSESTDHEERTREFDRFVELYGGAFGDRLLYVRGNHESYHHAPFGRFAVQRRDLPGVTLVMLDTSRDGYPNGAFGREQIEELDTIAAEADRPILVFGHHHVFQPGTDVESDRFFWLLPESSRRLFEVVARRPGIRGYFAGHTHRNRKVSVADCGDVPFCEVASVKDYPGSWAEYRIYESGYSQVHWRISTPEALSWTRRSRGMYHGLYGAYAFGEIADRCFSLGWTPEG